MVRDLTHVVFNNDLTIGARVLAKAIEQCRRHAPTGSYPPADACAEIAALCYMAQERVPGLDLSDVIAVLPSIGMFGDSRVAYHQYLETLALVCSPYRLIGKFSKHERIAIERLFAALHVAATGTLPVASTDTGGDIVGCYRCADAQAEGSDLGEIIGLAVREGRIDPAYVEIDRRQGPSCWGPYPDLRRRYVRASWSAPSAWAAQELERELRAGNFDVELETIYANEVAVIATRPLVGHIEDVARWGATHFPNAIWNGAQTLFSIE